MIFKSSEEKSAFLALTAATSLAFFAMVGFEELGQHGRGVQEPGPRLPPDDADRPRHHRPHLRPRLDLRRRPRPRRRPRRHAPRARPSPRWCAPARPNLPFDRIFPFIGMFAVANSALINMLMASRLLYGLASQGVLPHVLGTRPPGPAHALGGDPLHHRHRLRPDLLRGDEQPGAGDRAPRRHHGAAPPLRLHRRQHRAHRAPPPPAGRARALPHPRASCPGSARPPAPSSSAPGRGARRRCRSIASPPGSSRSASCSGPCTWALEPLGPAPADHAPPPRGPRRAPRRRARRN